MNPMDLLIGGLLAVVIGFALVKTIRSRKNGGCGCGCSGCSGCGPEKEK